MSCHQTLQFQHLSLFDAVNTFTVTLLFYNTGLTRVHNSHCRGCCRRNTHKQKQRRLKYAEIQLTELQPLFVSWGSQCNMQHLCAASGCSTCTQHLKAAPDNSSWMQSMNTVPQHRSWKQSQRWAEWPKNIISWYNWNLSRFHNISFYNFQTEQYVAQFVNICLPFLAVISWLSTISLYLKIHLCKTSVQFPCYIFPWTRTLKFHIICKCK